MSRQTDIEVAPAAPDDHLWQQQAEQNAGVNALSQIRKGADGWSAALGTLLSGASVAALLQGPGAFDRLSSGTGTGGKAAFFAAAVTGAVALTCAAVAGQVATGHLAVAGGVGHRAKSRREVQRALGALATCRLFALLSLTCLLLSGGILWFGPKRETRKLVTVRSDRGTLCGRAQISGELLRVDSRSVVHVVPLDVVERMTEVPRCPRSKGHLAP